MENRQTVTADRTSMASASPAAMSRKARVRSASA